MAARLRRWLPVWRPRAAWKAPGPAARPRLARSGRRGEAVRTDGAVTALARTGPIPTTAAGAAAVSDLTGIRPAAGRAATAVSAALGPAVASYTAVLIADTAVPAWHDAHREMPFLFVSSAASAAAGLGLICAADGEAMPMRRLAVLGVAGDLTAETLLEHGLEPVVRRAYHEGKAGMLLRASKALSAAGGLAAALGGGLRPVRMAAGAALLAASACTRFGAFHADVASAQDPAATIEPQRARMRQVTT